MVRRLLLVAGVCLAVLMPLGCTDSSNDGLKPDPNAGKSAAQREKETIDTIQNNPNMPADAKAAAIAAVQGHGRPATAPK